MQMMYETIYKALVETGLEKEYEPQDYLNFFCLGNREAVESGSKPEKSSSGSTPQVNSLDPSLESSIDCVNLLPIYLAF